MNQPGFVFGEVFCSKGVVRELLDHSCHNRVDELSEDGAAVLSPERVHPRYVETLERKQTLLPAAFTVIQHDSDYYSQPVSILFSI